MCLCRECGACAFMMIPIKIWYACISPANYMVDVGAQVGILKITYLGLWLRKCISSFGAFLSPRQTRSKGST